MCVCFLGRQRCRICDFNAVFTASTLFLPPQMLVMSQLHEVPRLLRQAPKHLRQLPVGRFLLAGLPFITYLLIFKFYIPLRHATHLDHSSPPNIYVLPNIEDHLFFCQPHKLLSKLANPVFDVLAAIPYLVHFPLPFLFGAYLILHPKKKEALFPYMWCAGWVNFLSVIIQFVFPTASPWFVDSAVLDQHGNTIYEYANEAGFKRLDRILGFSIFHNIYSHSPLKFGAFPSLHVAWPMIVYLNHPWFGKKVAGIHVLWITLAALYSTHHYLIDAVGGILMSVIVRLCILKVWSPFPELETDANGNLNGVDRLSDSYGTAPNGRRESLHVV